MQELRRSLPWAALVSLVQLVCAQTIVIGGASVRKFKSPRGRIPDCCFTCHFRADWTFPTAANASNVAAAAALVDTGSYLPAETLQLTDAVITNLSSLSLSEIALFAFADSNTTTTKRATASSDDCKSFPGDSSWPADLAWDVLDLLTGGALIKTVPLASPCYHDWGNYDATECAYITEQWTNSSFQYVIAAPEP